MRGIAHAADTVEETIRAIGDIARGATRVSRHIDQAERRHFAALISPREAELTEAFAYGASTEVVAPRFGLSPETVRMHRRNLFLKLGAKPSLPPERKTTDQTPSSASPFCTRTATSSSPWS